MKCRLECELIHSASQRLYDKADRVPFLLVDVCCLVQETAFRPQVTSLLHMRSAPSLSFLRLVGQSDYVIPVTTAYSLQQDVDGDPGSSSSQLNKSPNSIRSCLGTDQTGNTSREH